MSRPLQTRSRRSRSAGPGRARPTVLALVLLLGVTVAGLPKTMQPLHAKRAGHHAAGLWLADHSRPCDWIVDNHAWAHYYAGRVFLEGQQVALPDGETRRCFHVISRSKERGAPPPVHPESELEEDLQARGAELVYHWPRQVPAEKAQLVVYALDIPQRPQFE